MSPRAVSLLLALLVGAVPHVGGERGIARDPKDGDVARAPALPVPTRQADAVRRALRAVETDADAAIATWIEIAGVPAPSGREGERARVVARILRQHGFEATVLADGNVEATWPGEPGPPAVVSAHLDALNQEPFVAPRRHGDLLIGPGTLDDASGLAAMIHAASALREAGWRPRRELRLLATVGEEVGLLGAKSYLARPAKPAAFVAIDGILGKVDYGATGIRWTRWTLTGAGGHALLSQQIASPSLAAGRAISGLADLAEGRDVMLNVGTLRGGEAPNAIPSEVAFTVDLRADDQAELERLSAECRRIVEGAAFREGVRAHAETLQDLHAVQIPGHERSALVRGAADALRFVGRSAILSPRGSADHDIALKLGIPAMAIGATTGRHAHAPEESADIAPLVAGTQQIALVMVLLSETDDLAQAQSAQ